MSNAHVTIGSRDFKLLSALGKGASGNVYMINVNGYPEALKIIDTKGNYGINNIREIDIMSKFRHPNLVPSNGIVVQSSDTGKPPQVGIIMPLAMTDLRKKMFDPTMTEHQKLKILHDVTVGLKFLHDNGYLHLDLKPMNILLFNEGTEITAKITDFGLSIHKTGNSTLFPLEMVTVTHRAPEIMKGKREYSNASDVWSLGITFIEVLSRGKPIFTALNKTKIYSEIRKYLSPATIDKTLNHYIDLSGKTKKYAIDIIKKMLVFDPKNRATLEQVLASPLFSGFNVNPGSILYEYPKPPTQCDLVHYYAFDNLVKIALRLPSLRTETFFLAADIYQRALHFSHPLQGDMKKDWPNIVLIAMTSFYMAMKYLEIRYADPTWLAKNLSNAFSPNDILKTEAALVQMFGGVIYSKNLFTETASFENLIKTFELLRNCHIYHRINLAEWKKMQPPLDYDSNIQFNKFYPQTAYSKLENEYVPILYDQDKQ